MGGTNLSVMLLPCSPKQPNRTRTELEGREGRRWASEVPEGGES